MLCIAITALRTIVCGGGEPSWSDLQAPTRVSLLTSPATDFVALKQLTGAAAAAWPKTWEDGGALAMPTYDRVLVKEVVSGSSGFVAPACATIYKVGSCPSAVAVKSSASGCKGRCKWLMNPLQIGFLCM